ncbi:MAG: hypothetical protein D6775_05855 [Caldilineae bacterium]|nr:MAG: hypothetical protein D6775_05855 [Caldilineae bacterium]
MTSNTRRALPFVLVLLFVLGAALLFGGRTARAQEGPTGAAYRGRRIFQEHCIQCHGAGGKGDGPMAAQAPVPIADFTEPSFGEERSPMQVFDIISDGKVENLMPPWHGSLSQEEIWDTVAYIWSLHLAPEELASSLQTYESNCAECHGQDGESGQPDVPSLSNKALLGLTDSELRQAVSKPGHPPVAELTEADLVLATTGARSKGLGLAISAPTVVGDGVVIVTARNGTTGEVLANQPVRLYIVEGDSLVTDRVEQTDEQGRVRFENLPRGESWLYVAEVVYQDLPYSSAMQQFQPDTTELQVSVDVYEAGGSLDDISITRGHWVISLTSADSIDVGELYTLNNSGNRVYTGELGPDGINRVLRFDLPARATNVEIEGGQSDRFIIEDNVIIDTMPLAPGQRQILFRYTLPVEEGSVTIAHPIAYPVVNLNLLAPDLGMEVDAPGWVEGERVQAQGDVLYLNYNVSNLPANSSPQATFRGIRADILPAQVTATEAGRQIIDANATPGISGLPYFPVLVTALAVVLLGIGAFVLYRRQQALAAAEPQLREQARQTLIAQIAALDDAYEAGDLPKADYDRDRQLLKAQLMALMREETGT